MNNTTKNTDTVKPASKNPKSKMRLLMNIAAYAVLALVLFLTVIFLSIAVTSRRDTGVPTLFGTCVLTVESDSMKGVFEKGDLIFITKLTNDEAVGLKEGDRITYRFYNEALQENAFNTHEIIGIVKSGDKVAFQTQGVNNPGPDDYMVQSEDVFGVYNGRVRWLGGFINFLRSFVGFFLLVIFPLLVFFLYRVYVLVKVVIGAKKQKALDSRPSAPEDYDKLLREVEALRSKLDEKANAAVSSSLL